MKGWSLKIRKIIVLLACLNTSLALAAPQYDGSFRSEHVVVQLGAYNVSQGHNQHIDIQDLIGDTYTVDNRHANNGLIGLGLYLDRGFLSYGLNAFYFVNTSVSGNIIQENLFSNLSYSYTLSHLPVYAMLKSQIPIGSQLGITFDAGMGVNFMHLGQFSEKPIDNSGSSIENPFTSSTTNAFSATAGVGLKINHVIGDLPIELNYRYFYLGQGRFNHTNQASNTLNTGNVYAQAVMLIVEL